MTKNHNPKTTQQLVNNGRQTVGMDGFQAAGMEGLLAAERGQQMMTEGVQKGQSLPSGGLNPREYGHQVSPSVAPRQTFAPANGPKIPPMKK
ncbi:hypothetical protein NHB29_22195 (plasmid) [Pantoea agglomerans]|uniref:hypothetical protein n=1 Tax=Enterobacter agglomerans TaxID=549 RepID=UPI00273A61AC|nr:hypothetical protein [Pantoea agglomerans]WLO87215.1 hypothetical protein NHB29_22195 [Pantoea agglomerans]